MVPVHVGQIGVLLLLAAMRQDRIDRALVEQQHQAEAHIGRLPHLGDGGREQPRHALAAEFRLEGQGGPAAFGQFLVGVGKTIRRAHHAVLQLGALLVADPIERGQHAAGEFGGFLERGIDHVFTGVLIAGQRTDPRQACDLAHDEAHVLHRSLVFAHVSPLLM
jgi:hypothetical protein